MYFKNDSFYNDHNIGNLLPAHDNQHTCVLYNRFQSAVYLTTITWLEQVLLLKLVKNCLYTSQWLNVFVGHI